MTLINTPQNMLPIGSAAPPFELLGTDDQTHSLESFSDKEVLVIIFTCNHCPYAIGYTPKLVELQSKFESKNVQFVGINSNDPDYTGGDDSFENMKVFHTEYGMNFPYLFDEAQHVAKDYTAVCTPDIFVFDKERKLKYRGKVDDTDPTTGAESTQEWLEEAINDVIEGKEIETPFRPVIGCSIKWKPE